MGNVCVGSCDSKDGIFRSMSYSYWWSRSSDFMYYKNNNKEFNKQVEPQSIDKDCKSPPQLVIIAKNETKPSQTVVAYQVMNQEVKQPEKVVKKPYNVKRMLSAGLQADSVLKTKTGHLKEYYNLGPKLGHGQFGTTFLCTEKTTGKRFACKSIAKRKLLTEEDVEDVRREIEIMHHLSGHPNVVSIQGAYEDSVAVHLVMELCRGGELFDRITKKGHYSERKAADLIRTIFIASRLSEEEIAGLKQMFKAIDTDNSGYITFEELKAGLKRLGSNLTESEIYNLMQSADIDNNGTIDYEEFVAATLHINKVDKEDYMFTAFSYFDKDDSGYITLDELQQACKEFGVDDIHLEDIIKEADQNNDGRIDYNEFVAMMHNGNTPKKQLKDDFSVALRESVPVC
ncbi:hypothetical protein M8C21_013969 [Ambrosia artemisiifolia]|uniref:non-specific serine/threonine protein kinase n=1 Tax=Ambrosia artemisiifolia TaxID=4212 RepID=A0AAD5BP02_AMBAR|nr:hypothetical protein M8C21_013969 [Ambrosia artemisiifolia]